MSTAAAAPGSPRRRRMDGDFVAPAIPGKAIATANDRKREDRHHKAVQEVAEAGVYFDPKNVDPLSSRLVHRFMFAEFLGSLFFQLIAQGSVISSGSLTFQFNMDELTPGRILCIGFATSFVRSSPSPLASPRPSIDHLSAVCFACSPPTPTPPLTAPLPRFPLA